MPRVDEISHGPQREPRLGPASLPWLSSLSSAWSSSPAELRVAWAAAGVLIGATALVIATLVGGHDGSLRPVPSGPQPAAAAPASGSASVTAGTPATAVVGCDEDGWWDLGGGWQADSVRAGPVWLVGARATGYARTGTAPVPSPGDGASGPAGPAPRWLMVVHVDPGATVVLRAAAGSASYFQFIEGGVVGPYRPADGSQGLEFQACQRPGPGRAGWVDIYNVGFSIAAGRSAAVEVLTRGSAPAWLTFTAPAAG